MIGSVTQHPYSLDAYRASAISRQGLDTAKARSAVSAGEASPVASDPVSIVPPDSVQQQGASHAVTNRYTRYVHQAEREKVSRQEAKPEEEAVSSSPGSAEKIDRSKYSRAEQAYLETLDRAHRAETLRSLQEVGIVGFNGINYIA